MSLVEKITSFCEERQDITEAQRELIRECLRLAAIDLFQVTDHDVASMGDVADQLTRSRWPEDMRSDLRRFADNLYELADASDNFLLSKSRLAR